MQSSFNLLKLHKLGLKFGEEIILENVDLNLNEKSKVALIGLNGSGKSSLLKILAGKIAPDFGKLIWNGAKRVAYLAQLDTEKMDLEQTILNYLSYLDEDYWEIVDLARKVFGLEITDYNLPLKSLSGGEIMQLQLASVLNEQADLFLLDEPTNHLDILALKKLETYLKNLEKAFVCVSHNQNFIQKTCNQIWQIEDKKLEVFTGTLSDFLAQKEKEKQLRLEQFKTEKNQLKRLEIAQNREQEKSEKGAQNTRAKYLKGSISRLQYDYYTSRGTATLGQKSKMFLEKKTQTSQNMADLKLHAQPIILPQLQTENKGKRSLIKIKQADLLIGEKLILSQVDFELKYGEKVAILGPNGSGKTTFVKSILNQKYEPYQPVLLPAENLQTAQNLPLKTAYLNQRYELINKNLTVLENLLQFCSQFSLIQARHQLSNFKFFTSLQVNQTAGSLSGGEIARLALAMITGQEVDLLVLDEPTNNLDLDVLKQISHVLHTFKGGLLAISHDLSFLQDLGIEKFYLIKENRLTSLNKEDLDKF